VFLCEGSEIVGTGVVKVTTAAVMTCGESSVQFETLAGTAAINNTYFFKSYASCIGSTGTLPESEIPATPAEAPGTGPTRVVIEQNPPVFIHVPPNLGPKTGPLVKFIDAPNACEKIPKSSSKSSTKSHKRAEPPKNEFGFAGDAHSSSKKSAKTVKPPASCTSSHLNFLVKEITEGGALGPSFGVKNLHLGTVTNLVSVPVTFTETVSPEMLNLTPAEFATPPSQLLQQIPVGKTVNGEGFLSKAGTKILRKPDHCSKALNEIHFDLTVKAVDPAGDQQTIVKYVTVALKKEFPGRCVNGDTDGDNDGD
jgi:hypothetical protein